MKKLIKYGVSFDTNGNSEDGGMFVRDEILSELIQLSIETRGTQSIIGLSKKLAITLDENMGIMNLLEKIKMIHIMRTLPSTIFHLTKSTVTMTKQLFGMKSCLN